MAGKERLYQGRQSLFFGWGRAAAVVEVMVRAVWMGSPTGRYARAIEPLGLSFAAFTGESAEAWEPLILAAAVAFAAAVELAVEERAPKIPEFLLGSRTFLLNHSEWFEELRRQA